MEFAGVEAAKLAVAVEQCIELRRLLVAIAGQEHPEVLHRRSGPRIVEVDDVQGRIPGQHVAGMQVAVKPQLTNAAGALEAVLHGVEEMPCQAFVDVGEVGRDDVLFEQVLGRALTEGLDVEFRSMRKVLDLADAMDARHQPTDLLEETRVVEFRRASRTRRRDREPEWSAPVERLCLDRKRRNDRYVVFGERQRECVLFVDGVVAPAPRPVELGNDGSGAVDPDLVHAVFVAVQRQQAAVTVKTERLERSQYVVGLETAKCERCVLVVAGHGLPFERLRLIGSSIVARGALRQRQLRLARAAILPSPTATPATMPNSPLYSAVTREIADSPRGPGTVAFFDLDGTLIHGFSILSMYLERVLTGRTAPIAAFRQLFSLVTHGINGSEYGRLLDEIAIQLAGTPEDELNDLGEAVFGKFLAGAVYPESRALVRAHQAQGHTVAIVTSATGYQANAIARELGIDHVMCNRFAVDDGVLTGEVLEPICFADGKRAVAETFASDCGVSLDDCYFYTDGFEDLPLLDAVGYPRPLNPDSTLASTARRRDWPVRRFESRGFPGTREIIRTGLVYGAFFSAAVSILPTWFLNRSRRDAVNLAVTTWGEFGSALAGIRISVTGEAHLWAQRPAVFLFNHQSAIDVLIVAKLLRRDFTAIAKQEIAANPLVAPVFRVADTVFVDRRDTTRAIEALEPVVRTLRDGLSVAIAPEGTRSAGDRLGPFKKGPFHVAMQAGVPIVPVVIHNATDVLPKGGFFVRPAEVRVDVLPPVDTSNWRADTVDDHVADVRKRFVETLGHPPPPGSKARLKRVK